MQLRLLCFIGLYFLLTPRVKAQDQMPAVELRHFLSGRVWALERECRDNDCVDKTANNGYYWADSLFDGSYTDGTLMWSVLWHHAFYFKAITETDTSLKMSDYIPRLYVRSVDAQSRRYLIYRTTVTGIYEARLEILGDNSFSLEGPCWGSAHMTRTFKAVNAPQELADIITRKEEY